MLMLSSQVDREDPLYIIGPPKIRSYVEASKNVLDMYINYKIIVSEVTKPGVVYKGEDFAVRAFPLNHSKPCYGYCFEEDERPGVFFPEKARELGVPEGPLWAKLQGGETVANEDGKSVEAADILGPPRSGRKFSYVTDTLYLKTIAPEVSGSDLLICEGMFTDDLAESAAEKKHLTARQAGVIARDAGGVKKLGLIHYSPRYTERELKTLLAEARTEFPESHLTRDRKTFPILYED
jgi:ribonuclease Z